MSLAHDHGWIHILQAKEEAELPEYILGTVRLNRVKVDSAVPLEG